MPVQIPTGGGGPATKPPPDWFERQVAAGGGTNAGSIGTGSVNPPPPSTPPPAPTPDPPASPTAQAVDWQSYLGFFGLPQDVINEVSAIFQREPDVNRASQFALAYIRGTNWYQQTYPGIQEAIAKGIVRDERDYRQNFNSFQQVYAQYGRTFTSADYADALREGITADVAGRRLQGEANVSAYGDSWQYLAGAFGGSRLSQEQLTAVGRQQAGLQSGQGTMFQKILEDAQRRMQRAFEGVLASPNMSIGRTGRLLAPSLGAGEPDVGR